MTALARMLVIAAATVAILAAPASRAQTGSAVTVGILGWPLDRNDQVLALANDVEDCLTSRIRDIAPEVTVVSQRAVRDALFPLLEPATQPRDVKAFAAMLAREDVRMRLQSRGVRYLVAFSGGTQREGWEGGILCGYGFGAGGCLGFMWRGENTSLDAALWSTDVPTQIRREGSRVEGTSVMPAFVLPIPLLARTRSEACAELGTRIARAIRESAASPPASAAPRD